MSNVNAQPFSRARFNVADRHLPVAETVLLPAAAACAATGLAVAFVRGLALVSGMAPGPAAYLGLGVTAILAALATTVGSLFNLPITIRCGDFALSLASMLVGLKIDGPVTVGQVILRRIPHIVDANIVMPLAAVALWILTGYLTMVIARLYPAEVPEVDDAELERRLVEEWGERSVFSKRNVELVGELARRRVYDCMAGLYLIMILAAIMRPTLSFSNDGVLVGAGTAVVGGLLFYLAVVELSARRRLAEENSDTLVLSSYGAVWGVGAFLPALAAIVGGLLLPAGISPLAGRNYLGLFNYITVWFTHNLMQSPIDSGPVRMGEPAGIPGIGSLSGGNDIITFMVAVFAGLVGYVVYRIATDLYRSESERTRRLPMLLLALFLWPFHALWRWLRNMAEQRESEQASVDELGNTRVNMRSRRRRFRSFEPTIYVRMVYARMLHIAAKSGVERYQAETARELQERLAHIAPEADLSIKELTHVYCAARYAGHLPEPTWKRRAVELLRQVAAALHRFAG